MNDLKRILILLTGGLIVLNTFAAETPGQPIHVLYLGPVDGGRSGPRGGGFGGPRTNYVYLPGQTLAAEAIYFDHVTSATNLTEKYLSHFDALVQVMPDAELSAAQQQMLDRSRSAGNALRACWLRYSRKPGGVLSANPSAKDLSST